MKDRQIASRYARALLESIPNKDAEEVDRFIDADPARIRHSSIQSEEGGRFYHLRSRYMVVELPEGERLEIPDNYTWMTLAQLHNFVRYNNYLNIELRGLLACLSFITEDSDG